MYFLTWKNYTSIKLLRRCINFIITEPPVFVQDEDNEDKVLGSKDAATAQKIRKVSDWIVHSRKSKGLINTQLQSKWLINKQSRSVIDWSMIS